MTPRLPQRERGFGMANPLSPTASAQPPHLRILALVTEAYGAGGGIAQYNRDLFRALDASASIREVVVLPRAGRPERGDLPAKVRQLDSRTSKLTWSWAAVHAARSQGPFDAVFCGHLFSIPIAALAARLAGAPLWLQLHGIEAWERPRPWLRRLAEQARLVTVVSRFTRHKFLAWAARAPEHVRVLPNTVEERFSPGAASPKLQQAYSTQGKRVLLTVSRLAAAERYKGHDIVLRALAELAPAWPDLVYVVAGDGDDRPRLEALARQLGVEHNTRFIGFVDDEELPHLYRTADVFLMPSTGEGFGIVFLQALACGIPVIAGGTDGSRDPLRDGHDGHMLARNDPSELAASIATLLRRPGTGRTRTDPFARSHFDAQVALLLNRLVQQPAPGGLRQ